MTASKMGSSTIVNEVYKTNDLSIFKQMRGNRPVNPQHISRLAHSMEVYGCLQNPILVNQDMLVIDGQHRLEAARKSKKSVYYIIVKNYNLKEIQVLNLNQKNWTKKDFMDGYADMGLKPYIKLRDFYRKNSDYSLTTCIALCSNTCYDGTGMNQKYRRDIGIKNPKQIFNEGTWKGKDFELAQDNADKIRMIKPFYEKYNQGSFVSCILKLMSNENFNFFDFLSKLKYQSAKMKDCSKVSDYLLLVEDIYNYKRRDKVNLRY